MVNCGQIAMSPPGARTLRRRQTPVPLHLDLRRCGRSRSRDNAVTVHLETLGGLRLVAADGQAMHAQRRRLALLALLAAAGERGITRDQISGCLWSEATEEKAKHALNQLLYGIRQSLGEEVLLGVDPLRLDPELVDSDVQRFRCALAAGAHGDAVALYGGPFLDGFYLADAPEFERRVEEERARLATLHTGALERLAAAAEERGDAHAAVGRRRMLVELDRLDARRATAFMRALVAAGDSSGALSHGRTYETLVREELDAPADPAVVALANEIRAGTLVQPEPILPRVDPQPPARRGSPVPERSAGDDVANDGSVRAPAAAPRRRRRALVYGLAALVSWAAWFAATQSTSRLVTAQAADRLQPSIAVLPLKNLSVEPGDAALADGMTEELIAMFARAGIARVIASTSVFPLTTQRMDVRQIAESLHVSHLLEGALQKVGSHLRLQIRLVDARDGSTRWSETYDRDMGDVFAVQDDIARAVTRELGVQLAAGSSATSRVRRSTTSIAAYDSYLRARDPSLKRMRGGSLQAIEHLNHAIALDSNFAAAHAALVRLHISQGGARPGAHREAFKRGLEEARRAVALDDSLPEAYVALGFALNANRKHAASEAAFTQALALDPHTPGAFDGLALVYSWTGRAKEQLKMARVALELDPLSPEANVRMALALSMNGRCDEAIERLRPLKALSPPSGVAGVVGGQCYAAMHRWPEAIAEFRWAMETTDARAALAFLGYALARGGQRDEARAILSDLRAGRKDSHGAFGIATVYTGLQNYDSAFAHFEKAADEWSMRPYIMYPMFADLHRDPRFGPLKRRMGL
jgi:TolB-like protein/DNA-binding SARP family transcriptional activator/Tfp pilus assembly protein PilF